MQLYVETRLFYLPHLHLAPLGATPFEFQEDLWHTKKLDFLGYRVPLFASFSVQPY